MDFLRWGRTLTADRRRDVFFDRGESQLKLFGQPLAVHESYVLVATPFMTIGNIRGVSGVNLLA